MPTPRPSRLPVRCALAALAALGALGCRDGAPAPLATEVHGEASGGLVFARQDGAQSDLFRVRLADGAVRPLRATPDVSETWPFWSDAAGLLAFQVDPTDRRAGRADLLGWRPGGASALPLAAAPDRDERWAEWSPDGSRLAFAFRTAAGPSGLAWVEPASGRETVVARSGRADFLFRPGFAPDGRRLVAQRRGPDGRGSTLWLVDEGGARRLSREPGWFEQKPYFGRDGSTVVFSRHREATPGAPPAGRQLAIASVPGPAVTPLAAGEPGADEHSGRPSPTRDELLFVSDRSGSRDVWRAPLAGGPAVNLTRTPDRDEYAPRWSPDGERIVVTAVPPGPPGRAGDRLDPAVTRLVVLDREGRVLLETPGMMADWMPPF